jgi:hypothetical protein
VGLQRIELAQIEERQAYKISKLLAQKISFSHAFSLKRECRARGFTKLESQKCPVQTLSWMIIIDSRVSASSINGFGIFTNEDIKKGDVVWVLHSLIDIVIPYEELILLPQFGQDYARTYIYWSKYKSMH